MPPVTTTVAAPVWNEPPKSFKSTTNGPVEEVNSSQSNKHAFISKPTLLKVDNMMFLITDTPRQSNLASYIREAAKHGVTDMVRVCEPTYDGNPDLLNAGILLHEMAYDDGTPPPKEILERWLDLVNERFFKKKTHHISEKTHCSNEIPTIAVHCIAGLGRAPVLVAIALIEFCKMDPVDAVSLIRKNRRGAINGKQLHYLEGYKSFYSKKTPCSCTIM